MDGQTTWQGNMVHCFANRDYNPLEEKCRLTFNDDSTKFHLGELTTFKAELAAKTTSRMNKMDLFRKPKNAMFILNKNKGEKKHVRAAHITCLVLLSYWPWCSRRKQQCRSA